MPFAQMALSAPHNAAVFSGLRPDGGARRGGQFGKLTAGTDARVTFSAMNMVQTAGSHPGS